MLTLFQILLCLESGVKLVLDGVKSREEELMSVSVLDGTGEL